MPSKHCIVLCLVLMVPLLTARVFAEPNDEEEVRKTVGGFAQSWNDHDMHGFGELFTTDADFVNVVGDWWKGRQEIQMQHAYSHGTIPADTKGFEALRRYYGIFKSSTLRFSQVNTRFLGRDVAVSHATWELFGDTRTSNPRHGLLTFVLTRQDGRWFIAAAQNTEINRSVE